MDIAIGDRRRAFSHWLRTGRLPTARTSDGVELKFNPWHDPDDGRFTFRNSGRYFGRGEGGGAARSGDRQVARPQPQMQDAAGRASSTGSMRNPPGSTPTLPKSSARGTWTGGGGGRFGGGGATGRWGAPKPTPRLVNSQQGPTVAVPSHVGGGKAPVPAPPAPTTIVQFRTVVRNGYTYQIDSRERTRGVAGTLTVSSLPVRSRTSQVRAGGADRRAADDGGHYIAVRFNGPTEAFNHFAQDSNFNRGRYRVLENEWARDKRAGRTVTVRIVPKFVGESLRPSVIDVWWTVDGNKKSLKFPNERSERSRGQ